jgi:hypothetical protein
MYVELLKESRAPSACEQALRYVTSCPDGLLTADDIPNTTPAAATRALARLAERGVLVRVSKGLYFAPKATPFGISQPSEFDIAQKTLNGRTRLRGTAAANFLGVSTQVSARPEIVVFANNMPKHTASAQVTIRRGIPPKMLSETAGALIEFVRDRGAYAETSPIETFKRLNHVLVNLSEVDSLHLCDVVITEPPRVRAILGALLECANLPSGMWRSLRKSLNPLSKFDFGLFTELSNAKKWQAK